MIEYLLSFLFLTALGYIYDKYRSKMDVYDETENEILIRKYLLNDTFTPNNKPPLWIYINKEKNSRNWLSFGSRSSYDLNQPYLYVTLRSILNKSNNDFNVCIINDNSIHKLLPAWSIDLNKLSEPIKSHYRDLAMAKILYNYGGFVVPPSYLALNDLSQIYYSGIQDKGCFVCEMPSNSILTSVKNTQPSIEFMGCIKKHKAVRDICNHLEKINSKDCTLEQDFDGTIERNLNELILNNQINKISGKTIGTLDKYDNPITIHELLGSSYIDFNDNLHGIFIPQDKILKHSKYQWFARLNEEQIYKGNTIIGKYLLTSNE
tara:strand:+ start:28910 stop:29869 length:960 start_codon:yes stop_codon:yes gene_type:complete